MDPPDPPRAPNSPAAGGPATEAASERQPSPSEVPTLSRSLSKSPLQQPASSREGTSPITPLEPGDLESDTPASPPLLQEESIYNMPRPQQYQLFSPGSASDPRTMSQVSPGFIFVNFPKSLQMIPSPSCFRTEPCVQPPISTNPKQAILGIGWRGQRVLLPLTTNRSLLSVTSCLLSPFSSFRV